MDGDERARSRGTRKASEGPARPDPRGAAAERAPVQRGSKPRAVNRRHRVGWKSILIGVLVWCLLWQKADLLTLGGGLLVTWAVTLLFPMPAIRYRGRIRPWGLVRLVAVTLVDLVISSTRVAALAADWRRPVSSAVIGVRLRTNSDLLVAMIIELIGLVPGSVVVEHVRSSFRVYVHVLDVRDATQLEEARDNVREVERRVLRAFGSDEEIASLGLPLPPEQTAPAAELPAPPPAPARMVRNEQEGR